MNNPDHVPFISQAKKHSGHCFGLVQNQTITVKTGF